MRIANPPAIGTNNIRPTKFFSLSLRTDQLLIVVGYLRASVNPALMIFIEKTAIFS